MGASGPRLTFRFLKGNTKTSKMRGATSTLRTQSLKSPDVRSAKSNRTGGFQTCCSHTIPAVLIRSRL
eukprot:3617007-Karenia_brevis.AAC.1